MKRIAYIDYAKANDSGARVRREQRQTNPVEVGVTVTTGDPTLGDVTVSLTVYVNGQYEVNVDHAQKYIGAVS